MKQFGRIKSAIVCALLAAFVFSLLPMSFAQNSDRRTKNSSAATSPKSSDTGQANKSQSGAAKSDTQGSSEGKSRQAAPSGDDAQRDNDNAPTSFDDPRLNQTKGKRAPLPFDRPPLGSETPSSKGSSTPKFDRPSSSSTTTSPAGTASQRSSGRTTIEQNGAGQTPPTTAPRSRPSTVDQSPNYPTNPPVYDRNDGYSNNRNQPPVLRRGTDSDDTAVTSDNSNTNPAKGAPPVLHRPTDSREPNRETSSQPGWNQNRGNPSTSPNPQQSAGDDEPIKLDSTLVNIPLLVSDRSNRYIPRLAARDFLLYEDGIQQEIAFFGNEEVPFNVVLMLDMSPSVEGNTQAIQDAAIDFVRQMRSQDRVMIVSFDRRIDYLTDFTSDRYQLERAIRNTSTGSGTSVYEAVYEVVARRLRNVDGRKALILFSDGEDTTSRRIGYDDVIGQITESDVLVYGLRYPAGGGGNIQVNPWPRTSPRMPIPLPFPFPFPFPRRRGNLLPDPNAAAGTSAGQFPRQGRGGDFMTDVANAGGGAVYDAKQIGDMRGLANKIAEELRHVYMLSYYPSNALANGGFRSIRIRVKGRDDIAVRHRRGYNAREVIRGGKI